MSEVPLYQAFQTPKSTKWIQYHSRSETKPVHDRRIWAVGFEYRGSSLINNTHPPRTTTGP